MADLIITASTDRGLLYACVSPSARFAEAQVDDSRLGAVLHPFRDEEAAEVALIAAGGTLGGGRP